MKHRRSASVYLAVAFLALYGGYCIWSVHASAYGWWYEWNLRLFGVACIVAAGCLYRGVTWGRYVAYVLAALTIYSWLYMTGYTLLKQPQAYGRTALQVAIGVFITLVPPMGVIGSVLVAHRTLRRPRA